MTFEHKLFSFEVDRTYTFARPDYEHQIIGKKSDKGCSTTEEVSLWTSYSTESHPSLCNKGAANESKSLLLVTILAAMFCIVCTIFINIIIEIDLMYDSLCPVKKQIHILAHQVHLKIK